MLILVFFSQKSNMVEEAIDVGTRINCDSSLRGAFMHRIGCRTRCFSSKHRVLQRVVQKW